MKTKYSLLFTLLAISCIVNQHCQAIEAQGVKKKQHKHHHANHTKQENSLT